MNKKGNSSLSAFVQYKNMAKEHITLRIFEIIDRDSDVSQGKITIQTGLAASLVHSYMSNIIAKGWIRAKQVSAKRWLYFMTPEGFIEKSRLTMHYMSRTLKSYRVAQLVVRQEIYRCLAQNNTRFVIAGENELAEITVLNVKAGRRGRVMAVVSSAQSGERVAEETIYSFEKIRDLEYDVVFVCDAKFYEWLANENIRKPKESYVDMLNLVVRRQAEGII